MRCQSWQDSKVDRTESLNHTFHHNCELHVGTISAYPSLSKGEFGQALNECGHDRPSWHYVGVPITIEGGLGLCFGRLTLSKGGFGAKNIQSGHYRGEFGTELCEVGIIGDGIGLVPLLGPTPPVALHGLPL